MTAAAISGDFATYRHVQGRKVLQLVIEVPAEMASAVFAALGTPGSGEGIPVALARLQTAPEPIAKPEAPKERRPFSELPYSTQAAMRCQEQDFHSFLKEHFNFQWLRALEGRTPSEAAADVVRHLCRVESRSDLKPGTPAGETWAEEIEAEYWAWQRGRR